MNWSRFEKDVEIYALVLKGTVDIQGMIAVEYDDVAKAVHIIWGVRRHIIIDGNMADKSTQELEAI